MNMNSTTAITLNDRFSMIKKPSVTRINRGRSRSKSREPRQRQRSRSVDLRGSHRNQALLNQLERQHKMRMALKLKNKSILTTRGRIQGRQIARTKLKRAATIRNTMNARTLRQNNLTKFVPLNDTPGRMARGRSRSRSRSRSRIQQNIPIQDRLGFPAGRRRMRRGGLQANGGANQRSRSRSRVRLNRNNFRNGNQMQAQLKRSNSVNSRLGGNANIVQRRQQQQARRRTRSQSRGNQGQNQTRKINRPLQGRITKHKTGNAIVRRNAPGNVRRNTVGNAVRKAKKFIRGQTGAVRKMKGQQQQQQQQQGNARGRARNRVPKNGNQQGQQGGRRGRSRTRRGGGNNRGGKTQISKAALDKQLDDYMSKGSA